MDVVVGVDRSILVRRRESCGLVSGCAEERAEGPLALIEGS